MMKINDSLGYLICRLARKVHQQLTKRFSAYDITPEQWVLLKLISENEGLSQKQLAQQLQKDQNNIKAIADKLEIKELISRTSHPTDKRTLSLKVTPKGNLLLTKLLSLDETLLAELEAPLDASAKASLVAQLIALEKNMDDL